MYSKGENRLREDYPNAQIQRHSPYSKDFSNYYQNQRNNSTTKKLRNQKLMPSPSVSAYLQRQRKPLQNLSYGNSSINTPYSRYGPSNRHTEASRLQQHHNRTDLEISAITDPAFTLAPRSSKPLDDRQRYNVKQALISTKIQQIHNYQNKIGDLLDMVKIKTPSKYGFSGNGYSQKSREKYQHFTNTSMKDRISHSKATVAHYTPTKNYGRSQKRQIQLSATARTKYNKNSQEAPYTHGHSYVDTDYNRLTADQEWNNADRKSKYFKRQRQQDQTFQTDINEQRKSKSKQFMKAIEGEVQQIRKTVNDVNEKVKQTDRKHHFKKQVSFDQLSSSNAPETQFSRATNKRATAKNQIQGSPRSRPKYINRTPEKKGERGSNRKNGGLISNGRAGGGDRPLTSYINSYNAQSEQQTDQESMPRFEKYKLKKAEKERNQAVSNMNVAVTHEPVTMERPNRPASRSIGIHRRGEASTSSAITTKNNNPAQKPAIATSVLNISSEMKKSVGQIYKQQK